MSVRRKQAGWAALRRDFRSQRMRYRCNMGQAHIRRRRGTLRRYGLRRVLRTNAPDMLAAGDCVETWHRLLQKPLYLPLGTAAHKQGRLTADDESDWLGRDGSPWGDKQTRRRPGPALLRDCVRHDCQKAVLDRASLSLRKPPLRLGEDARLGRPGVTLPRGSAYIEP
jgi:hypothetical protein